ncbi:glycoside hydrolase family 31 protein [Sporolactobacillus shoreicorticis]|uniref:Glycoside hydrolase family 31 protein n=1 Tax=Sporolactobacillus shoreicorticis TaxID=1923877 RepID=A0ABW5S3Q6_9BACL|nr:glycoside hydrolase family 31 protein [Sporolactobacillus shoreicorticis]MCO7124387.1 glycoside hydrolase family 31 protein [Sporolactobacillus shoreicorticis]
MFGELIGYARNQNRITVEFEKNKVIITVITPSIINFFAALASERRPSKAIEHLEEAPGVLIVDFSEGVLTIRTEQLTVKVTNEFEVTISGHSGAILSEDYRGTGTAFIRRGAGEGIAMAAEEGHKLSSAEEKISYKLKKKLNPNTFFYGLGEKTGHLNKKGYHYRMWNTDDPSPHVESFETLYKSIPFLIALKDNQAFGYFFDTTFESQFDLGKENSEYYSFAAVGGNLDYFFIYGPSVKEVVTGYTKLTGTTPLPQLWTLGYQQSRWAYAPEARLNEVADTFRKKAIPCDVLHLDIDYMDGYRVFTWDRKKFPNPEELLKKLKTQGFKVVTIIDPGVKKDRGYSIYDQGLANHYFATDKDGIPYVNQVWPGDALFPDFSNENVRNWWADNQKIMTNLGVSGIWNDMNEPASFKGPLPDDVQFNNDGIQTDHREIHNVYGHYMAKATYEGIKRATGKRPFVITRACYAGTQKYSTVWTGDNQSLWEHLRMALPILMNLGLSGVTFCGTDVGGFGFDCTSELLSRWVQVGAFTPLFRNHSSIFTRDQEPWAFDEQTESINRKYINLRYQLLPYLYDLLHDEEISGLPIMRPLLLDYQNDPKTYEINDQFLCGEAILVAPVVEQGAKKRLVYLPKGSRWIDFWTKESHQGGQYIVKTAPLDVCPIYVKAASFIPLYPVQNYVGEKAVNQLTLDLYLPEKGEAGSYIHYQDDGESFDYRKGSYNLYEFTAHLDASNKELHVSLSRTHNGYEKSYDSFILILNNTEAQSVSLNDAPIPFEVTKDHTVVTAEGGELHIKL